MFHWIFPNHPCIQHLFETIKEICWCHRQKICMCYQISFLKFSSNFFLQFLLQPKHLYSFCIFQIAFTIFVFSSTRFKFFVIMHIFTFNFMNSSSKTTDKICVCHKSCTINIRVRNTKKVMYFSVFSPKQLNCSSHPSISLFMIKW